MREAAREELRKFADATSSQEMADLAIILLRNLKELENMSTSHKEQTATGLAGLKENLVGLGKEVTTGFERVFNRFDTISSRFDSIFNQEDGLAARIMAIGIELKHKPGHKVFYGAVVAQLTLLVGILVKLLFSS
jgi:hypothetical protein